jgi:hypothetical protein
MKTRKGPIIFVFLAGMILGATQPALLYGGATTGGNLWDPAIDQPPYPPTHLTGPLSIYYAYQFDDLGNPVLCGPADGSFMATMYYTVRLKYRGLYLFQGSSQDVCMADIGDKTTGQIKIIRDFLGNAVATGIFANGIESWKLKSIDDAIFNPTEDSNAFVADIVIAVKENPKPKKH